MHLIFSNQFISHSRNLSPELQDEIARAVARFKENPRAKSLHNHKLHGRLAGFYSFSVNFRYRIVYEYITKETVVLTAVGDHSIYD